jgi:hypothetical protein
MPEELVLGCFLIPVLEGGLYDETSALTQSPPEDGGYEPKKS